METNTQGNRSKRKGASHYKTKFDPKWRKEWPCIQKGNDEYRFFCSVCFKHVLCSHQGLSDVKRHIQYQGHQQAVKHAAGETEPLQDNITSAEIKMTVFLAKHNLPIAISDEFENYSDLFFLTAILQKSTNVEEQSHPPF